MNQIEIHPFYQQTESIEFMKKYNAQPESCGPFAEGRNNIFQNEVLVSIAKEYDKTVAQVILRWLIQRGIVTIPKTVHKERMIENIGIFDFELSQEDVEKIAALDTKRACSYRIMIRNREMAWHA